MPAGEYKTCQSCGEKFYRQRQPANIWRDKRYCSKSCGYKSRKLISAPNTAQSVSPRDEALLCVRAYMALLADPLRMKSLSGKPAENMAVFMAAIKRLVETHGILRKELSA